MRTSKKASKPATKKPVVATLIATAPVAVKPVAVAKPVTPAKPDERAARQALTDAARAAVAKHYNGASLTAHSHRVPKLADCIARISNPVQRATSASVRDESLLLLIADSVNGKPVAFEPASPAIAADLGVLSRLASLGMLAITDGKPTLTQRGADYAKAARKAA